MPLQMGTTRFSRHPLEFNTLLRELDHTAQVETLISFKG
jgi:hypothetical protein